MEGSEKAAHLRVNKLANIEQSAMAGSSTL
jgi:hypothetical protein